MEEDQRLGPVGCENGEWLRAQCGLAQPLGGARVRTRARPSMITSPCPLPAKRRAYYLGRDGSNPYLLFGAGGLWGQRGNFGYHVLPFAPLPRETNLRMGMIDGGSIAWMS